MFDTFLEGDAIWFSVPAALGTVAFLFRIILMLMAGVDADHGDVGDAHPDSGHAFEILSIQGIAAFLMGFGWAGIGGLFGAGWGMTGAVLVAIGGGVVMVWLLAALLRAVYGLQSSGNILIEQTLGLEGEAVTRVPSSGNTTGQVQLVINERQRTYRAISSGPEISSRTRVRVVEVNTDNSVTVEPA